MIRLFLLSLFLYLLLVYLVLKVLKHEHLYVWWTLRPFLNHRRISMLCDRCPYQDEGCNSNELECLQLIRETAYAELDSGKTLKDLDWFIFEG